MHPGFNIIMRLNTTKQWMRLMWQYDTSVIIALRLKLSMTVWQKNRQTRLEILCVKKHKFPKPAQRLARGISQSTYKRTGKVIKFK